MLKKLLFLLLVIAGACNQPAPKETSVAKPPVKAKSAAPRPAANPWMIKSFAPQEGETEGRKFVKFVTDGVFSDSVNSKSYLFAEVNVDKLNGGIFLRELKKTNPPVKFDEPVSIRLKNTSGEELQMTSTRRWNASGGILIERRNNDYSQFRIFMLRSKGPVSVEISSGTRVYSFTMNADGFSDSFTKL